jgi:hypothetical protein
MNSPTDHRFPAETNRSGPWLLDPKALEELDRIINDHWRKLEKRREALLGKDIEEFKKKYVGLEKQHRTEVDRLVRDYKEKSIFSKRWKLLYVYVKDAPRYSHESFEAASQDMRLLREAPIGFVLDVLSGETRCEVSVGVYSPDLKIKIEPDDVPEAQGVFSAVYEWARELQRHTIGRRIWGRIADYRRTILFLGLVLYGLLFFATQDTILAATRDQLSALYQQGITDNNVIEAVKLLAHLQTREPVVTPWLMAYYPLIYIYLTIALYVRPRVVIGIGRGRDWLMVWKVWRIAILAPVVYLVLPEIVDRLRSLFFPAP